MMLSDSHSSTMAKATGLIFSLFGIASAQEVPFAILLYMQCILRGLTSMRCDCFNAVCMGSPPIIRLCHYIVFNHNQNHRRSNPGGARGLQLLCKRLRYFNRAVGNLIKAHRVVKEVVYEANKDGET